MKKLMIAFIIFIALVIQTFAQPKIVSAKDRYCKEVFVSQTTSAGQSYAPGCMESRKFLLFYATMTDESGQPLGSNVVSLKIETVPGIHSILLNNVGAGYDPNTSTIRANISTIAMSRHGGIFKINIMMLRPCIGQIISPNLCWSTICSYDIKMQEDPCTSTDIQPEKRSIDYGSAAFELCAQAGDQNSQTYKDCRKCFDQNPNQDSVWTAVGCIPTKADKIITTLIKLGLGLGGGFALLTILAAAFMLSTSQGDPKAVNEAKDKITAAVVGLLFIIFSVTILEFIGVKVLNIPGFGT